MPAQVILAVASGPSIGQQYSFAERTTALIGREQECHIRFPKDKDHQTVSRHHCLLDINPPEASIRDLGSRSGTYVNGQLIGKRDRAQSAEEGAKLRFAEHSLTDGDEIKLGSIVLRVTITSAAPSAGDLIEIPEGQREKSRLANDEDACATGSPRLRGYRIEKELGRGGMGAVYLAVNEQTGERVALKTMLPDIPATQRVRDQFLREAASTKVLRHRHVVELRELQFSEGSFFFTLEYCEGGSVADLLKKSGKLPVETAVPLVLQALEGLEYAHRVDVPAVQLADGSFASACGLVHRDIKPGNILLAKEGNAYFAKIGDYGLAKAFDLAGLSGLSMSGQFAGTPGFMPRRQLLDYRNARPEVDVWAMAASLYFMLTLCSPREFKKGMDSLQMVLQTDAVPIRQRCPGIPAKLATVIDHALVEKPEIGYQTAAAFAAGLMDFLRSTPATAGAGNPVPPSAVDKAVIFETPTVAPGPRPGGKAAIFQAPTVLPPPEDGRRRKPKSP